MKHKVPKVIQKKIRTITGKRSRVVVEHILTHGSITTEDLERQYGYQHPPRAIRDVREQGLRLERFWTKSSDGRKIAGYRFGDPSRIRHDRFGGRVVFSKEFEARVLTLHDSKCSICQARFERRYLQIDHRVPYEVAGDTDREERVPRDYMPLCGSCNRAKSWSCEHCENWRSAGVQKTCRSCYWASPENYKHVALREIRRMDLVWEEAEVEDFDRLVGIVGTACASMPDYVKEVLRKHLRSRMSDH